jgi:hypothetical protein
LHLVAALPFSLCLSSRFDNSSSCSCLPDLGHSQEFPSGHSQFSSAGQVLFQTCAKALIFSADFCLLLFFRLRRARVDPHQGLFLFLVRSFSRFVITTAGFMSLVLNFQSQLARSLFYFDFPCRSFFHPELGLCAHFIGLRVLVFICR